MLPIPLTLNLLCQVPVDQAIAGYFIDDIAARSNQQDSPAMMAYQQAALKLAKQYQ